MKKFLSLSLMLFSGVAAAQSLAPASPELLQIIDKSAYFRPA
ncbi:hypothetical protein [Polynucleobacter sp. JS-Safj-400b-B2]|nr:hypothetical protein [Polynucleobacter sp. JS-Safj-400b-B2]